MRVCGCHCNVTLTKRKSFFKWSETRGRDKVPLKRAQIGSCFPRGRPLCFALFLRNRTQTIMRRPKGIKTRKSVAKRFKITARGKVMRMHAGKRHLLQTKNAKRRRGLGTSV